MSTKTNQKLTQREFEIETSINSDYHSKHQIYFEDVFKVEEYMIENFYKAQRELSYIKHCIRSLREQIKDYESGDCSVPESVYQQLEIQTFRKEKLIQDTRKLFDKLSPDMFFQYLKEIYENTKTAAGTGTMSSFFEKLESESA
jgi:hypothetical protein